MSRKQLNEEKVNVRGTEMKLKGKHVLYPNWCCLLEVVYK